MDHSTTFSPSKLDTYRNCPRQYKFRYVDRIPRKTRSIEAYVGTCVHAAFESLYESIQHGKVPAEDEVLGAYERAWERERTDLPIVMRDKAFGLDDWRRVGADCVRNYYRANAPFDRDRTIAVERKIGFALPVADEESGTSETFRIEGYVDRLAAAPDGSFEINDYKTGKSLPTQSYLDEEDWQLPIYNIAVLESWPGVKSVRLRWHYVRSGVVLESARNPERLRALRGDIAALIRTIRKDGVFEPVKSALCDWCDYRDICPVWKHAESVAKMPEAQRRHESGVELVDRYAALEAEKKSLRGSVAAVESEIEDLTRRILEYAERNGLMSVAGTDASADIHAKEEFHFPTKTRSPEEHDRIEGALKGTPIWGDVSRLDAKALMDGFREKRWPPEVMRLIEGWIDTLIRHETAKTVRLHKRKGSDMEE